MKIADWFKIAALAILLFTETTIVSAQEIARAETVMTRPRPDYDAIGAPVGRFLLYPEATLDIAYDDNILAAGDAEPDQILSDTIALLAPAIALRSDWSRNALNLGGRVLSSRYNEYSSQDFTDWELWTDGEYEFGPNRLEANISYSHLHELRTSSFDQSQGLFPTEFDVGNLGVGYLYAPNRLYAGLAVDFSKYEFDNAFRVNPPQIIDNSDRDRLNSELRLRAGYFVSPAYSVYLESRLYDFNYDENVDRFGNDLDQDGYDIVVGSDFDMSGVTSGQVFVGYRNIDYADSAFETQNGPVFGLSVDWNITQLTTVSFLGSQRLYGTTVENSSGIEAITLGVGVDHELRRNVILGLDVAYVDEDYLQITRKDELLRINVGAEYFLTRYWSLNGGYRYQQRDSNDAGARQFEINQFYLGIRGQI